MTDVTELYCDHPLDIALILGDAPVLAQDRSLPSLKKIVLCSNGYILNKTNVLARLREQLFARKAAGAGVETWEIIDQAPFVFTQRHRIVHRHH